MSKKGPKKKKNKAHRSMNASSLAQRILRLLQKEKELNEKRREMRLRQKELEKNKELDTPQDSSSNLTLSLENFDIDKNTKN